MVRVFGSKNKGSGFDPQCLVLDDPPTPSCSLITYIRIQCKLLWIKVSAKSLNREYNGTEKEQKGI